MEASELAAVRERPLTVDGVRSRVLETGPEDATEAIVFVHGNPNSADEWRGLMRRTGGFARSIVALQSSTAKIEFHLGDTPQLRPIGRMPPSWTSPRLNTV